MIVELKALFQGDDLMTLAPPDADKPSAWQDALVLCSWPLALGIDLCNWVQLGPLTNCVEGLLGQTAIVDFLDSPGEFLQQKSSLERRRGLPGIELSPFSL